MIAPRQTITVSILAFCLLVVSWVASASGSVWKKIGGPVDSVFVGYYPVQDTVRVLATMPPTGDLFEFGLTSGAWTKIGGPGSMFTVEPNKAGSAPNVVAAAATSQAPSSAATPRAKRARRIE